MHRLAARTLLGLVVAVSLCAGGSARAQVKVNEIVNEVKAAFSTWETISCTKLKFEYKGLLTTFASEKEGAILVYFGHDNSTWSHGTNAYYSNVNVKIIADGDIHKSTIELNARDYFWSIGGEQNKIDIQTAVLHMLPNAIGFYVGSDTMTGSLRSFIKFNYVLRTLDPLHKQGAQFTYFKAGTGCTQPAQPPICGMTATTPDGGTAKEGGAKDSGAKEGGAKDASAKDAKTDGAADAGPPIELCIYHSNPNKPSEGKPYHWIPSPIPYYIYVPNRGKLPGSLDTAGGDGIKDGSTHDGTGGTCTSSSQCPSGYVCADGGVCVRSGGGDDDGCCRVSHARRENLLATALLALGLLLFSRRMRRRR